MIVPKAGWEIIGGAKVVFVDSPEHKETAPASKSLGPMALLKEKLTLRMAKPGTERPAEPFTSPLSEAA